MYTFISIPGCKTFMYPTLYFLNSEPIYLHNMSQILYDRKTQISYRAGYGIDIHSRNIAHIYVSSPASTANFEYLLSLPPTFTTSAINFKQVMRTDGSHLLATGAATCYAIPSAVASRNYANLRRDSRP